MKPGVWMETNEKRGTRSAGVSVAITTTEAKGLLAKVGRVLRGWWRKVDRADRGKCSSPSKPPPEPFL